MPLFPPWTVGAIALAAVIGLPLNAWRVRGRAYAVFALVILALSLPGVLLLHARLTSWARPALVPWIEAAFVYGLLAAVAHLAALVRARLRPTLFRWAISIPGMAVIAAGALGWLWLLALVPVRVACELLGWQHVLAALRWLDLVPIVVAAASVVTSIRPVEEIVRVTLGREGADDGPHDVTRMPLERYRRRPAPHLPSRPLRIVQITDPHLGPWQPVHRLRQRIADLAAHDPDLVLLTGDLLTMEGMGTPGALAQALAPLQALAGRCFAALGNHDYESPEEVRSALEANGIQLLVDDEALVETGAGLVQIVGADYVGKGRREHIQDLLARLPRRTEHVRILLLHDPLGFRHVPKGDVDLTLSGHTHGGQVGLVSFGFDWTVLSRTNWPDHGLFALGSNRLYVHRGTGFYGFPLRIGVPGEASVLELVLD